MGKLIPRALQEHMLLQEETATAFYTNAVQSSDLLISFRECVAQLRKAGKIKDCVKMTHDELTNLKKDYGGEAEEIRASEAISEAKKLFERASTSKASDIGINVKKQQTEIEMRVLGNYRPDKTVSKALGCAMCNVICTTMAKDGSSSTFAPETKPHDARVEDSQYLPKGVVGIRIATIGTTDGYRMTLRLLYEQTQDISAESTLDERLTALGFDDAQRDIIAYATGYNHGLNLIAGPTGSGKSTTLKQIMESLAIMYPGKHLMSVEDPPEYPIRGVNQVPVKGTNDETDNRNHKFGEFIRSALRNDPDILLIGEIRDSQSAMTAVQAAMTGHGVWSSIHCSNVFLIPFRLLAMLPKGDEEGAVDRDTLFDQLTTLVRQELVPTLCPHCKQKLEENIKDIESRRRGILGRMKKAGIDPSTVFVRAENGCEECEFRGITKRTVVAEVVTIDPMIIKHLIKNDTYGAKRYWLDKQGGKTILSHAIDKIRAGEVDPADAEATVGYLNTDEILEDGVIAADEIRRPAA